MPWLISVSLDLMVLPASISNAHGDLISAVFLIVMGLWVRYAWPRSVRQNVARGKLTEEDARARFRTLHPKTGYTAILAGVCLTCLSLFQMGIFHDFEWLVGALMLAFSAGLIAFAIWLKRKSRHSDEV